MKMSSRGRKLSKGLRGTALVVALFFTWTLAGGATAAHAVQLVTKQTAAPALPAKRADAGEKFAQAVAGVETLLADESLSLATKQREVKARRAELVTTSAELRSEFAATAKKLKTAKLAPEIQERQQRFVDRFEENLASLKTELTAIESAKDEVTAQGAIATARAHLARSKAPSRHQPLDPNKLPHRSAEPTKQQPRLHKEEFERAYGKDLASLPRPVRVAALGALPGIIPADNDAPVNLGLPSLDDLAGTVDAPYSPAIEAKAAELGHDPLKIYNWVRNTIEFVPTWGSIQGAQLTLETKQGNAFDTASLLIALLRASHIEARYVLGTVTLPIDKIQNWAGGFTDPMAALDFMSSGGIPTTALTEGGKISSARFEHVWVEAWIDYFPSRGARHIDGQGEMWVPLDASYKQYTYTQGLDLQSAVPFDAQSFVDQLKASATINEAQGYATGVNGTLVQQSLSDYQSRVEAYIAAQHPNATVGDVLGKKEIVVKDYPMLAGTLPYKTSVRGAAYALLPASLRHGLNLTLQRDTLDSTPLTFTKSLPELAGKRITVNYEPATEADKATIDAYASQNATAIPAYLIQMRPVIRIGNDIVASGEPIGMGTGQDLVVTMSHPNDQDVVTHKLSAGEYCAVGLNVSGIGLEQYKNRIEQGDFSEPVAEMLHQIALSYWAEVDAFNNVIAKSMGMRQLRHPSELAATAKLSVTEAFGMPVSATYKSRGLDVKSNIQSVKPAFSTGNAIAYMQQSGAMTSIFEGIVFDQLFNKDIGNSISSISVINYANEQGIKIFLINSSNINQILPMLQIENDIKINIVNAVNSGNVVQIPISNINFNGWNGIAYVVTNQTTGSGAYLISGGLNGGETSTSTPSAIPMPKVPNAGPAMMVVGSIASSAGLTLEVEGGVVIGLGAGTAATAAAAIVAAVMAVVIIFSIIKSIADKYRPLPNWQLFRHYTSFSSLPLILYGTPSYIMASETGDLGPGAYVTKLFEDPLTMRGRISDILNMDIAHVETYIDVEIDRNRVLLLDDPLNYPEQYVHPFMPIMLNGVDARVVGSGSSGAH
jgi:hypothetical protein